ncbi:hypothetical protein ACLKA7_008045 [Drosophila subpalustris]
MKSESARSKCQDNLPLNPSRLPTSTARGSRVSHRQLQQQPHSHLAVTKPIYVTRQPAMLSPSPSPSSSRHRNFQRLHLHIHCCCRFHRRHRRLPCNLSPFVRPDVGHACT